MLVISVCEHEYGDALHENLKEDFKYVLFRVIADVKVDFSPVKGLLVQNFG